MHDEEYLRSDLERRGLEALGCSWIDEWNTGDDVDRWNFILDGPRVLVTSSSGMYLRSHSHHVVIAPAAADERDDRDRVFVAARIVKAYASRGRSGFLQTLHRTRRLTAALEVINLEFEDWRSGEHAVPNQPAGQRRVKPADFDRAFRAHPNRPGEPAWQTDALAEEIYVPSAEAEIESGPTLLKLLRYTDRYSWLEAR